MTRLNKKVIREAIKGSMGIYAIIARKCSVTRGTITQYFQKHPEMVKFVEEEREKMLDIGETKLMKLINEDNFQAVKFFLSTKGKSRGYIETKQIEATVGTNEDQTKKWERIVKEVEDERKQIEHKNTKPAN